MTQPPDRPEPGRAARARLWLAQLGDSPILDREKVVRARSRHTPVALAAFVCGLGVLAIVLFSMAISRAPEHSPGATDMATVAFLVAGAQLLVLLLCVPPLAAPAIAGERERGTLDPLVLGRSSSGQLVAAKALAPVMYLGLMAVVAVPVMLAVFLYAGLDLGQFVLVEAVTMATVAAMSGAAVLIGARWPGALGAVMVAYLSGIVLFGATLLAAAVLDYRVPLVPGRGPTSSVHPVVFVNPFYAIHALVVGPTPAGAHLGHLLRLLFSSPGRTSTWGPVIQPWQLSALAQLTLAGACLCAAARTLNPRPRPRPRPRGHLSWRRAAPLAALLVAVAATVADPGTTTASASAATQDAEVTVVAQPRWGRSVPGTWTTYEVTVRNDGADLAGAEVVLAPDELPRPDQVPALISPRSEDRLRPAVVALGQREMTIVPRDPVVRLPSEFPEHRVPLELAGGGTEKRVAMVVVEAPYGHRAEVRNRSGAPVARSAIGEETQRPRYTVAVVSQDPAAAKAAGRLRDLYGRGPVAVTAIADAKALPGSAIGYSGLDALVVERFDTSALEPAQVRALRDFVALGGGLVLGGGDAGARSLKALPAELVPLAPSGSTSLSMNGLAGIIERTTAAAATVVTGEVRAGRTVVDGDNGVPLVVQAEHRAGRVVQLAFDPLDDTFASDPALADLAWQQGVARVLYGMVRTPDGAAGETVGVAPVEQLWPAVGSGTKRSWPQWPRRSLWLLALYGAVLVPLGAEVLRRAGRARRLWMAAPAAAAIFALVAGSTGQARAGNDDPPLDVVTVGPAGTAMTISYRGFQALGRDQRRIAAPGGAVSTLFTAPNLAADSPSLSLAGRGGGRVDQRGTSPTVVMATQPGSVRNVEVVSIGEEIGLESQLRLVGSGPPELGGLRVTGRIVNRSRRGVHSVRVQLPEGAQARVADRIQPGQTLTVDAGFVWPGRIPAGSGVPAAAEERLMFAAADQAFTRAGQAAVVGLGEPDESGGTEVIVEVVPLKAMEIPAAGTGRSHLVAAPGVLDKTVLELDAIGPLAPMVLSYGTYSSPPDVYDWTTRTWRALPPGDRAGGVGDSQPLNPTEVRNGTVRIRAFLSQSSAEFTLAPHR